MSEVELCRLCANFADDTNSQKLFEQNQCNLLRLAEDLLGLELQNAADLPQFICEPCQEQTMQAHEFRERCIRVQLHFAKATAVQMLPQVKKEDKLSVELELKEEQQEEFQVDQVPAVEELIIERVVEEFKPNDANDAQQQQDFCHDALVHSNDSSDEVWEDLVVSIPETADDRTVEEVVLEEYLEATLHSPQSSEIKVNDSDCASSITATKQHSAKRKRIARKSGGAQEKRPKIGGNGRIKQQFVCEQCGKHVVSRSSFELHMSRHTGDKQYICETCPEKFFTKSDLKRHTYKHTGERPIECRYCDRRFIDQSLRTKHEKTHTNERPHACTECDKRFNQKQHLDVHMQLHTGERFFSCAVCNSTFQRKSNLTAHLSTTVHKHNVEKQLNLQNHTNNIAEGDDSVSFPSISNKI